MISNVMERHVTAAGYSEGKKRAMVAVQHSRGNNLHSLVMELMFPSFSFLFSKTELLISLMEDIIEQAA